MILVRALLVACFVSSGQCDQKTVMIEKKACGVVYHGQLPDNGRWVNAIFRINCS